VVNPFEGVIEVDGGIKHLLTLMWDKGIDTEFSCEGGPCQSLNQNNELITWIGEAYVLMPYTDKSLKLTYNLFMAHPAILEGTEEFVRFGMQDSEEYGKRIIWKFPHTSIDTVTHLVDYYS
jgi:hypothetical protein